MENDAIELEKKGLRYNRNGTQCFTNAILWFIFCNLNLRTCLITDLNAFENQTAKHKENRKHWKEDEKDKYVNLKSATKNMRKSLGG